MAFGFGTITSQGVGSNLDVAGIVSKLMQIERAPLDALIQKKDDYDAKISALGKVKSALSTLQSSLSGLKYGDSILANKATSADTTKLVATADSGAVAGNYSVDITKLAQSQKLVAAGQADTTSAIGSGTSTVVTIDLGTTSGTTFTSNGSGPFNITIDSTNNTLTGIRDEINNANAGVTATIVNDGSGTNPYRLVLTSTSTGADQSMKITTDGADATIDSLLTYDPAGTMNLTETVTAQDASFTVDGIAVTKSSNTVTDVIQGVTLDLLAGTGGSSVNVSVTQDTSTAVTAVQDFVNAYNDLAAEIKSQTDSGYQSGTPGALASDYATSQILDYVRNELTAAPTGVTGTYANLSDIGVSFEKDGTLSLDTATLTTAVQTDSTNVANLFSTTDGYATRLNSVLTDLVTTNGTIDQRTTAFEDRISLLDDRQVTLEGRLSRTEARLRAQYTNLDVLVGTLSTTSSYLSQQLSALNGQSSGG
jgi:flagellar hook-associated protein 2